MTCWLSLQRGYSRSSQEDQIQRGRNRCLFQPTQRQNFLKMSWADRRDREKARQTTDIRMDRRNAGARWTVIDQK